ncbi:MULTISPECIES: hypothetical protein [Dermabacter]|uniref:hypothetical protein n=1 Tax=Dermabacter TaxID=36739 RepID=UPI0008A18182|nr:MULTISPECIES: hypothetical protein [Dermabacter]MCT1790116.1 hypothetical protein [Dermabacter hominis]OFT21499.1 hypothetical protein HMPREF3176_02210 [Dermabacter sp. HMSC08H10]
MSDARTLSRTDYTFRARGHFALSQDEAWDRMTQQWLPAWLGLQSIPLMVGGPLVKNPGKNRQIIGKVLGSALGHRIRVEYDSPLVSARIIVQATLMEDEGATVLELDVENAPSHDALETLREAWSERVAAAEAEVAREHEAHRAL